MYLEIDQGQDLACLVRRCRGCRHLYRLPEYRISLRCTWLVLKVLVGQCNMQLVACPLGARQYGHMKRAAMAKLTGASNIGAISSIIPKDLELSGAAQCICAVGVNTAASLCDPMTFCQTGRAWAAILLRAEPAAYGTCQDRRFPGRT